MPCWPRGAARCWTWPICAIMVGFGARALIVQAMEASGAPVTEEEMPALVEIFLAHYRAHIADGTRLFPAGGRDPGDAEGAAARGWAF